MGTDLRRALDAAGVRVSDTRELQGVEPQARAIARGGTAVTVNDPGPSWGQMALLTDELGVVSWHFAPRPDEAMPMARDAAPRGAATRTYHIPSTSTRARGVISATGKKVLQVLVFPILEPGIGLISDSFARRWEQKHRPYRIRTFTPGDYADAAAGEIDQEGWRRLSTGRALLLVHGTFSRAHTAFGALPPEFVAALHRRYEGRVFAFDHFTLSEDPKQNVAWLIEHLPDGITLDLDIVCHSRGGLVSRVLSERQADLALGSRLLRVASVVFVGTPNQGTTLADADHMGDFIDTYTNLFTLLPDTGATEVLTAIVTVAKQLAVGAAKGLPGLQAMRPGGEFANWLNAGPRAGDARYFALASDFTPAEPGLKEFALDRLMDKIFQVANDLVVPTEGVFEANGSSFFPIEQRVVFGGTDAVAHTGYFASGAAREKMLTWLSG
jgi:hypothetical protein